MKKSEFFPISRREFLVATSAITASGLIYSDALAQSATAGVLRIAYGGIGPNRHPHNDLSVPDNDIANVMSESLLIRGDDGNIRPLVAESVERVGDRNFAVKLRSGIKFHDGSPLTSQDVKVSFDHYLSANSVYRYLLEPWLERIEIQDDLNFQIIGKKPYRPALSILAQRSRVIPRWATDPQAFALKPIGTGPYRFVEYIPNDRVVVEANPNYWGEKPKFQRIIFRQISEESTRLAAVETGEVDAAVSISPDEAARIKGNDVAVASGKSTRQIFLWCNALKQGPLQKKEVRQAINHAVDKDSMLKNIMRGYGAKMLSPIPEGVSYRTEQAPFEYDVAKAKALLAQAGYPNGFDLHVACPKGRYLKDEETVIAVAGQLEQVGIKLKVSSFEFATLLQQVQGQEARKTVALQYDLIYGSWGNSTGDGDFAVTLFSEKNLPWNFGSYTRPEVEKLVDEGQNEVSDEKKLKEIYDRIQSTIWQDVPLLFLFQLPAIMVVSKKVHGLVVRPDELIMWKNVST